MDGWHLRFALAFCLAVSVPSSIWAGKTPTLKAGQAKKHIGQTAKVCGQVAAVYLAFRSRGQPTFLNFGRPYPHSVFTAVIWGLDRGKFGNPEQRYLNKRVCVTGDITAYHGQPEMVLHSPKQVTAK